MIPIPHLPTDLPPEPHRPGRGRPPPPRKKSWTSGKCGYRQDRETALEVKK